eukprot:scaffold70300_cov32-Phaeocystis_antarctica.AAC.1
MLLNVGPSTAFFASTPVISGAIMETAARERDAAADRMGSWSAAEEKVDARKSIMRKGPRYSVSFSVRRACTRTSEG